MDLRVSAKTVVAGFGVFAATRGSGGFAVDYWALRREGAGRRDALGRVLALGFLEYATLSIVALLASIALYAASTGTRATRRRFPSLLVIPAFAFALWATSRKRVARLALRTADSRLAPADVRGFGCRRTQGAHADLQPPGARARRTRHDDLLGRGHRVPLGRSSARRRPPDHDLGPDPVPGGPVLSRRSLPAGGAGVVEVALTLALVGMGVRFAPALIAVLIYRLFNFWLPIVPALALIPRVRDLRQRFQRAEQAS